MARGDKPYYRVEVPFVEGPEFFNLSSDAWKLYSFLMARCISTHRTTIYQVNYRYLASHTGLSYQRIPSALRELADCPYGKDGQHLTNLVPTGDQQETNGLPTTDQFSISIEGMARNNPKYQWSDSPLVPHTIPIESPLRGEEHRGAENIPPTPQGGAKFEDENEPIEKVKIDLHMDAFAAMKKRYPFATNEAGKKIYRSDWRRAESEWKKIMRDGKVSPDQILRALDHYAATTEARYVCGAERFLTKKLDDALREADPLDTFDPDDRMTPEEEEYARKAEAGNWQADEIAFWARLTPEQKAERLAAIERAHGRKLP